MTGRWSNVMVIRQDWIIGIWLWWQWASLTKVCEEDVLEGWNLSSSGSCSAAVFMSALKSPNLRWRGGFRLCSWSGMENNEDSDHLVG